MFSTLRTRVVIAVVIALLSMPIANLVAPGTFFSGATAYAGDICDSDCG